MEAAVMEPKPKKPEFREPLISFIVPVYNTSQATLQRCLASLDDQDYANREIIVVMNGMTKEQTAALVPIALKFKDVQVLETPEKGACLARNMGFRVSKGEIVSFFNADYMARPGMARRWIDALISHPECGFAYGGYEYATTTKVPYPSKPFDEFLLSVANYIDCGFPLWRKYVVEWDENCQSLQDWDFWIRVVKDHHVKGFYLGGESSFYAEPSGKPGGLSEDSATHWIDRVHYIKAKNGIPEPQLVVTSLGAPFHGKEIAKMLKADFRDDTLFKPNEYKTLYMIGFYNRGEDLRAHGQIIADFKDRGADRKVIIHFVGADIYWLRHRSFKDLKYLAGALRLQADSILSENEQARRELMEMGIMSDICPIPPYNQYEVRPLPEQFKVAVFLTNRSDFDKYCLEETLSIIRVMPDVQFMAYGDAADQSIQYENCKCVGNLSLEEWKDFVYENSCLFRLVRHDTLPTSSNEFILAGRDVITNIPMPFMELINTAGTFELNQWDIFQEGLNPYHWPKTKSDIVQRIRAVRDGKRGNAKDSVITANGQQIAADFYTKMLDRKRYIEFIYERAALPEATQ